MKKTVLKRGTKPLKRSRIKPVTKKQLRIYLEWKALGRYLAERRVGLAGQQCEIPWCYSHFNLQAHHIIFRRFNIHNAGNCLITCCDCHRHDKYGPGIPIPAEQALIEVALLNKKYGIDPRMTGADVLRMKE